MIRCVNFDCFTLRQCIFYKVRSLFGSFIQLKSPQMMNYPLTLCDVELLQLEVVRIACVAGRREGGKSK